MQMQASDFIDKIRYDPPFSYHRPHPHNKSVLIGAQAEELKILFEEIYSLSLVNPLMTAIVGNPGTGKTHFLWNLEYRTNQNHERSGIVLIYELKDKTPNISDIIEFIHKHETFRKLAINYKIHLSDLQESCIEQRTKEINDAVEKISQGIDSNFGICIGVDIVDEFIRQTVNIRNWSPDQAIVDLLGSFRLILDSINKVCIIFALTKDVYNEMIPVVGGDQTLRRRFIIANGVDDEPVEFGQLKENEAYILVSTFMKHWARRNGIDFTSISNNNETWPFTKRAVKLAWRMAVTPGGLSLICMDAILEKISKNISQAADLSISELDIAISLKKNKSYPYLISEDKIWNEVEFLINANKINKRIIELKENAEKELKLKGDWDIRIVKDAFKKYFEDCGFNIEFGMSDLIVGNIFENFSKAIGIIFIDESSHIESTSRNDIWITRKEIEALSNDLIHNKKVDAGLYLCIVDNKLEEEKRVKYDSSLEKNFKNQSSKVDYTTTLLFEKLNKEDFLKVIGLRKLDLKERKILVEYLDKELKFKPLLESLMFTEPSIIPKEGK